MSNNCSSKLETDLLENHRPVFVTTNGDSMWPLMIHKTSKVMVVPIEAEPKVYDIPLYKRENGEYVIHRIVRIKNGRIYTRGDNRADVECINTESILGTVKVIRNKNNVITVNDKRYKLYIVILKLTYPLRFLVYKFRSLIRKISRRYQK